MLISLKTPQVALSYFIVEASLAVLGSSPVSASKEDWKELLSQPEDCLGLWFHCLSVCFLLNAPRQVVSVFS